LGLRDSGRLVGSRLDIKAEADLDVGRNLGNWGEIRAGLHRTNGLTRARFGDPKLVEHQYNNGEYFFKFSYDRLENLVDTYRRLANAGIDPVWCINHGPTTSLYYEDPDGNRIELQVDNFATNEDLLDWLGSGEFDDNPIGVEFDPNVLERLLIAGTPVASLVKRGSAPPDGRRARAGMRTLRWKTL